MTSHSSDRFCTIITDASWCPQEHVAGWAAWLVCNDERYKRFDAFFDKITSAQEAEIKAILNGCFLAKRVFSPDHYHIVSDCTNAMDALRGKGKTTEWQERLQLIVGNSRVTFAHVKAHSSKQDKRTWVNNWCDMQAKLAMRQLRVSVKTVSEEK